MAKRVPAGEMRHRVEIQSQGGEGQYDGYGQITSDWNTVHRTRAKIESLRGAEGDLARQVYAHATERVTIDYVASLNTTGATRRRVCFNGRALHIGHIANPDEENVQLELLCGEAR